MPGILATRACATLRGVAALAAAGLFSSLPAGVTRADITPLLNTSSVVSASWVGPIKDTQVQTSPLGPPDPWNGSVFSNVTDGPDYAYGTMFMSFSATTTGLRVFSGGSATSNQVGVNAGAANLDLFIIVNKVQNATILTTLTLHDLSGSAGAILFPFDVHGNPPYQTLAETWGTTNFTGRIPPGTYLVDAWAKYDSTSAASGTSPTFSIDADFVDCPNPLVTSQPTPQTTPVGSTTHFSVGTSSLAVSSVTTGSTFQWRRNLVNLSDGGRISGATTNHLVISNTAYADSGSYDVVVTQGSIVEPSSLAKLTVTSGNSGVPVAGISGLQMDLPAPNPAHGRTRVSFALPAAMPAELQILDVSGRVVKTLLPYGMFDAGPRSSEWDGTTERGSRAPSGIYFIRLSTAATQIVRRVVNLASY
ncbi:MAG TPA: FlgD immunoglobulin-like domain containing protein [Candidatus Sulfotelmatobacter sp.]|nr:FlgD immunoglobulin-like domain containing protein [Candidatus Sulfotelmatobacter sp.]